MLCIERDGSGRVKYYPSVEFLDAGKFKMNKFLRQELNESKAKDYDQLLEVKKQIAKLNTHKLSVS